MIKTYVIIHVHLITDIMISESLNKDSSYRISLDGTLAILKFKTRHPNTMAGYKKYDNTGILAILKDSTNW